MNCRKLSIPIYVIALLAGCGQTPDGTSGQADSEVSQPAADLFLPPEGVVAAGAEWITLANNYVYTDGPTADSNGDVYFSEVFGSMLYRIDAADEITLIDDNTSATKGLLFGPDGLLYGCRNDSAQIIRYAESGEVEVLLQGKLTPDPVKPEEEGEFCNDLAMNANGGIWFTDRVNRRVIYLDTDGSTRVVAEGFRPNGIAISADQQLLAVTDSEKPVLHAFRVESDNSLSAIDGFFDPVVTLPPKPGKKRMPSGGGANGMTVDTDGRFYLTTFIGVQVFSADGKYLGLIDIPRIFASNVGFGGVDRDWLYVTGRVGIFKLKMQVQGLQ